MIQRMDDTHKDRKLMQTDRDPPSVIRQLSSEEP